MTGRCIIVTGSSSGLGYEVARYLCEGGNDVILACRSEEKANRAIEKIKRTNPNALATYMQLDLTSVESIKKFAEDFVALEKKLHVLVNNAGIALSPKDPKRQFTTENFELTMGTNYLGPFLLTNLLLETLKKTGGEENGDARIINVAASTHDPEASKKKNLTAIDYENFFLFNKGTYNASQAYKNSKAALIMFTYDLAKKLENTGVSVNAVCPGFVPGTDLIRNAGGAQKFFHRYVLHGMLRFTKMTRSITQGAQNICNLVSDEKYKGVSGKYIKDAAEVKSSEETLDEESQAKLYELSAGYVALEGFERIEVVQPPPEEEEKPKKEKKDEKKEEEGEEVKEGEEKTEEAAEGEKKEEGETEEKKEEEEKTEEDKETTDKEEIAKEEADKKEDEVVKEEEKKTEEPTTEKTEEEKKE